MKASIDPGAAAVALLMLLASVMPLPAMASLACTANPVTSTLTATLPATPINTVGSPASRYLTAWIGGPAFGSSRVYNGCTTNNSGNISMRGRVTLPPTGRSIDGFPIFATGVPGVGIIVQGRDQAAPLGVLASNSGALDVDWTQIVKGWSPFWDASFGVRLVSIGDAAIRTGTVSLGRIGEITLVENGATSAIVPVNLVVNGSLAITSRTCSVSVGSRDISVAMGTVYKGAFAGVGTTAGSASFSVLLDSCSAGLKVFMTITDSNNPGNTSDALSLTPGTQAATGIGIRITRQDNAQRVRYGAQSSLPANPNQMSFGTTTGTTMNLPFNATYVQTLSAMTAGTANAIATFTLSYQ